MGISSAATIRVGNALGAGQPVTSQKMSVVAVGYSGMTSFACILIYWSPLILCILFLVNAVLASCVTGVILYLMKNSVGKLFINDEYDHIFCCIVQTVSGVKLP